MQGNLNERPFLWILSFLFLCKECVYLRYLRPLRQARCSKQKIATLREIIHLAKRANSQDLSVRCSFARLVASLATFSHYGLPYVYVYLSSCTKAHFGLVSKFSCGISNTPRWFQHQVMPEVDSERKVYDSLSLI